MVQLLYTPTLSNSTNDTWAYSGVSFAFETLSEQQIVFDYTCSLLNFWGDFVGMAGTLMGLDAIKVCTGIPTALFALLL